MAKRFLTADWRNLFLVTYAFPPDVLAPYLLSGLEPDTLDGQAFASLVAFDFHNTRVKGIRVPFHINFPEINLRYYVKNVKTGERGVGFVREIVPLPAITMVANWLYNENYATHPTRSKNWQDTEGQHFSYATKVGGRWHKMAVTTDPTAILPEPSALDDFFKEQTCGFGQTRRGQPLKYAVKHPRWRKHPIRKYQLDVDFLTLYGPHWAFLQTATPFHVMLAKGSAIEVYGAEEV